MCGIAGIFDFEKKISLKGNRINRALRLINYRGPDDLHYINSDDFFYGGAVRLSIEALNYGKQPIKDNRYVVAFNGEIFNYKELALKYNISKKLFNSEIQFLLEAWKIKGNTMFKDFEGQFAIFIYDSHKKELVIARDPFGIRPLFFISNKNFFSFCSEIKGLSQLSNIGFSLDKFAVGQISMFWSTVGDRTIFENIKQVKRGHYLVVSEKKMKQIRYWEEPLLKNEIKKFKSYKEAKDFLLSSLESSIKMQCHGEVGYASYLSGGIDSSALSYFLKKLNPDQELKTFSITFENKEYDESSAQREIQNFLRLNHTSINIKNYDISSNFRKVINHAETLLFRTAPVPLYLLSKKVNETGHKVVFTGEGADEILLGYDLFAENRIRRFWSKNPGSNIRPKLLSKLYSYLPQFKNSRYFNIIKDFYSNSLSDFNNLFYSHFIRWQQFQQVSSFFNFGINQKELEENILNEFMSQLPTDLNETSFDRKAQILEFETLLSGYLLSSQGDRMTMANSVEGRYPFLSQKFVKDISKISDNLKTMGIRSKSLFRDAMYKKIPNSITKRPKIAYQAPEAKCFLDSNFISDEAIFLNDASKNIDIINKKNLLNLNKKITNKYSSERLGFRENMAYIMCMSAAQLVDLSKKWNDEKI